MLHVLEFIVGQFKAWSEIKARDGATELILMQPVRFEPSDAVTLVLQSFQTPSRQPVPKRRLILRLLQRQKLQKPNNIPQLIRV